MHLHCTVCDQTVERSGPWCQLYCEEKDTLCVPMLVRLIREADPPLTDDHAVALLRRALRSRDWLEL